MKLYIDTNIYLSYISPTSDITSLKKLKELIINKKVELVLPSQTRKEYLKNFKDRVCQEQDKLKKANTQILIPNELKNEKGQRTAEENEIIKNIDSLNTSLNKYRTQKILNFGKHIKTTEREIEGILKSAILFEYTDEIILKALIRYAKDLPPKKNNQKFGDSIIWETLKDNIRNEDLVIVSFDSDFSEKTKNKCINKILEAEWRKNTKKNITLYPVLGEFVNTIYKEDPVSKETIKRETFQIGNFANSITEISSFKQNEDANYWVNRISDLKGIINTVHASDVYLNANTNGTAVCHLSSQSTPWVNSSIIDNNVYQDLAPNSSNLRFLNKICKKCKKTYMQSLTRFNVDELCDDCSS